MAVILINKENRMQVFNLAHNCHAIASRRTNMRATIIEENKQGDRHPRRIVKSICDSLTVPAKARIAKFPDGSPLPPEIRLVPEIARAIDLGKIRVITVHDEGAKAAPKKTGAAAKGETKKTTRSGGKK